jgi:predicted DNA-binding transcriptional regulator YafY
MTARKIPRRRQAVGSTAVATIRRWLRLLTLLRERLFLNKDQLALEIGCSRRTIQHDLATLRREFGAPIEFDTDRNGFYLADRRWRLDNGASR